MASHTLQVLNHLCNLISTLEKDIARSRIFMKFSNFNKHILKTSLVKNKIFQVETLYQRITKLNMLKTLDYGFRINLSKSNKLISLQTLFDISKEQFHMFINEFQN